MRTRVWAASLAALIILGASACTPVADLPREGSSPSPPLATDVRLSVRPELDGRDLTISGVATVPDGALIMYEVSHLHSDCAGCVIAGIAEVKEGRFTATMDVSSFEPGRAYILVTFQTIIHGVEQPASVITLYGEKGEHITARGFSTDPSGLRSVSANWTVIIK